MADSKPKLILEDMAGRLSDIEGAVGVGINDPLPEQVPADGLINLREGKIESTEETLGGFDSAYVIQHFSVEVYVSAGDNDEREAKYDAAVKEIGMRLYADRTLGGLCFWLFAERGEPVSQDIPGAASVKAGTLDITVHYETQNPLG